MSTQANSPAVLRAPVVDVSRDTLRCLRLNQLHPSNTKSQQERRATFKKEDLDSLAETIKSGGVIEPIIVRPCPDTTDEFEIVAGERRWLASKRAGRTDIPSLVRSYSDVQVIQIQTIENLQRTDLNAMAEAEAYDTLIKEHRLTVEAIADRVGKKRDYIYRRLKLLALSPHVRAACRKGDISDAVAFVIALITDHDKQKEALERAVTKDWSGQTMSASQLLQFVQNQILLRLDAAPFATEDESLVPAAGTCGRCPKKTGNQPGLFQDVKRADLCTDATCFHAKRAAAIAHRLERAQTTGQRVIDGKKAKEIVRAGSHQLENGWVSLDQHCSQDLKHRTYREILGRKFVPTLIVHGDGLVEACDHNTLTQALKDRGIKSQAVVRVSAQERAARETARRENEYRRRLGEAVREKTPRSLSRADLHAIALTFFTASWNEIRKRIVQQWAWQPKKSQKHVDQVQLASSQIAELSEKELVRLLCDLAFANELQGNYRVSKKPTLLLDAAKRRGVNLSKLRAPESPKACAKVRRTRRTTSVKAPAKSA